jgi:hypothetical protein
MRNNIVTVNYPGAEACTFSLPSDGTPEQILEIVFAQWNHGSGQECDKFVKGKYRSLSVNDFVRVNGEWFQCASVGWVKRDDKFVDAIEALVVNHPDVEAHGEWFVLNGIMFQHRQTSGEKMF